MNQRLLGLDVLRFIAVILVLGRHCEDPPSNWPEIPRHAFLFLKQGGWIGVDLFFVLSGFLVSGLLFREYKSYGRFSIGKFYVRRGWKIYPPFYAFTAITLAQDILKRREVWNGQLLSELLFVQNYFPGRIGYTWSLAVEEHFYLLLPLALLLILKLNTKSKEPLKPILALVVFVAFACLLMRLLNWYLSPSFTYLTHVTPSHLRFDSLYWGVGISYVYHFYANWFFNCLTPWRAWLIVGGVFTLLPAFLLPIETTPIIFTLGFTIFYLGSGALLCGVLLCKIPSNPLVLMAATLGSYSYSIYLWHLAGKWWGVGIAEKFYPNIGFVGRTTIYVLGAFVVGVLMAKIIEIPALRIRDAWFPSRVGGLDASRAPSAPDTATTDAKNETKQGNEDGP